MTWGEAITIGILGGCFSGLIWGLMDMWRAKRERTTLTLQPGQTYILTIKDKS